MTEVTQTELEFRQTALNCINRQTNLIEQLLAMMRDMNTRLSMLEKPNEPRSVRQYTIQ